jgi:hypothetical protein
MEFLMNRINVSLLVIASMFSSAVALAQTAPAASETPASTPAAKSAPASPTESAPVVPVAKGPEFKRFHVSLNPLGIAILGRYGANLEFLPAPHHAIQLYPYFGLSSAGDEATGKSTYTNFGGELAYRFYSNRSGAEGFFVGPFVAYNNSNIATKKTGVADASGTLSYYGAGIDLGGQAMIGPGITIGAGFGLQYLKASTTGTAGATSATLKFEGVIPRFLSTIGFAF